MNEENILHPCARAKCRDIVTYWRDPVLHGTWVQHGKNREARRFFAAIDQIHATMLQVNIAPGAWTAIPNLVFNWLTDIHSRPPILDKPLSNS